MALITTDPRVNVNNIRIPLAAAPEVTLANQIADQYTAGNVGLANQNFYTLMYNLQLTGKGLHPSQMTTDARGRVMRHMIVELGWAAMTGRVNPGTSADYAIPLDAWQVAQWA